MFTAILGFQNRMSRRISLKLIAGSMISCFIVVITHLALSLLAGFSATHSILFLLPLSALALLVLAGFVKLCKRLLGVYASAPAFVFFNILFIWGIYAVAIRPAISPLMDIVMSGQLAILIVGLFCILTSDPGVVKHESPWGDKLIEASNAELEDQLNVELKCLKDIHPNCSMQAVQSAPPSERIRYCRSCQAYIKGFDHHCPAFGNCIGQKNHILFMMLLGSFISTESSYIFWCSQFAAESQRLEIWLERSSLLRNLVISTMIFCILQILWQGLFLTWHIYCICANIRTDEWINWMSYPEFHLNLELESGQNFTGTRFRNPYDRGVVCNIKEFLAQE